ncbi:hypothetical protein LTR84_013034 [Exophiala bonariae]|uniref:Carrier domain-containing protein n=1 Tax=Exophiala bonariae TaxID=1690606 RepID=A0AAV9NEL2_9EURO|nr:hypothetical protein LTR84_013034 [Exophiala bonariae]
MGFQSIEGIKQSDIAVIGLSCPAYTEVPSDRYNAKAFHHEGEKLNTLSSTGGHFLGDDVSAFDAPFFNITANEAKAMDPTARMLLEVTYEALENAGIPVDDLVGSDTSCYVGCFTRDFHEMLMRDTETSPMYAGTGTGFSLLSNRVSWFYDLRGPSLTLDTACSSSLVGLHLACQGLRSGESKIAIVSGANLILSPDLAIFLSNLHMLSKEGLSRSFADGTTGYGRGEGIATVILKPLKDAIQDQDNIRAVIRGTGVNQDGHTTGITLPNSDAQAELITSTYRAAGLEFSDTGYFEAHGTGTAAGDPLELGAVANTLGSAQRPGNSLLVGSVKSNIGHLEGAAGLAGVIKCILMLENATILPNIHFDRPNRRIPFKQWNIEVPTTAKPWPSHALQRASVNSFGYGGTNAHAIIDSTAQFFSTIGGAGPYRNPSVSTSTSHRPRLFIVSARDGPALDRIRKSFTNHLAAVESQGSIRSEAQYLADLAFTLSERRTRFDWKAFAVASTISELREQLSTTAAIQGARSSKASRVAFVFTGQGAQWARMGLNLLQYPVFQASVSEAERHLTDKLGCDWSVLQELQLSGPESNIQLARISQPMCTILQIALVDLLASWSIRPSGVVGHSSGEIGAAYAYGALSRQDAWTIAYWRGKLCSELTIDAPELKGSMMAVGLSREAAADYILGVRTGKLVVACVNSPSSVTISGDEIAIDELYQLLKTDSVFARKLKVENAYHSHHMEQIAKKYLMHISGVTVRKPESGDSVIFASSVWGRIIQYPDLGPDYWVKNLVSPVLFSDAVEALFKSSPQRKRRARATEVYFSNLLEVGPHAALKGPLRQTLQALKSEDVKYASVLNRGQDDAKSALACAGMLYIHGVPVSIPSANVTQMRVQPLADLPAYPWNHALKYWSESRLSKNYRFREHGRHDLLGSIALGYNELEPKWRNFLRVNESPWIRDHVVHSTILYPGAGILAMPIEAMRQMADKERNIDNIELKDVYITKAIVVPDDQTGTEAFLQLRRPRTEGEHMKDWWEFSVFTCLEDQSPQENGSGRVMINYKADSVDNWVTQKSHQKEVLRQDYQESLVICKNQIQPNDFYETTKRAGLDYGDSFQGLTAIRTSKRRAVCTVRIPDTKATMPGNIESQHLIHPTTLDVIFHSLFAALGEEGELNFENAAVPVYLDSLIVAADLPSGAGSEFHGFCTALRPAPREIVADICYSDSAWTEPKVYIRGLHCRELPGSSSSNTDSFKAPFGTLEWKPDIHFATQRSLAQYFDAKNPDVSDGDELCKLMALVAHKTPDLTILQLGVSSEIKTKILSFLTENGHQGTKMYSKYTVAAIDSSENENNTASSEDPNELVTALALHKGLPLSEQKLEVSSADLLIVGADFGFPTQAIVSFHDIANLLQDGGIAIFEHESESFFAILKDACIEAGLTSLGVLTRSVHPSTNQQRTSWIIAKPYSKEDTSISESILILEPTIPTSNTLDISNAIKQDLSRRSIAYETIVWPPKDLDMVGRSIISLLEMETPFLVNISPVDFEVLKTTILRSLSFLWVTKGKEPTTAAAMGYLRSLKNENPNLNLRYLRLEDQVDRNAPDVAEAITSISLNPNIDREFVEINGQICINRWMPDRGMSRIILNGAANVENIALQRCENPLELVAGPDYHFKDSELVEDLSPEHIQVETRALVLSRPRSSTHDNVAPALREFSGLVKAVGSKCKNFRPGDLVYGYDGAPYRTNFTVDESQCQKIPAGRTFPEAATWSLTFMTAYQALIKIGQLRAGNTILIQDASSGVGQAAIQLSLATKARVFATARSATESQLIEKYGIPNHNILNDADPYFAETIGRLTRNCGFDLVLNISRQGDGLRKLWQAVAPLGNLTHAGDSEITKENVLDIGPFQRGCKFSVVDLALIHQSKPGALADLAKEFAIFATTNLIQPLEALNIFPVANVAAAFKSMDSGVLGETILIFDDRSQISIHASSIHPLRLDQNASYVLVGGMGGLGRSLARLLVRHGARHLIFISRSGIKSAHAPATVDELRSLGASAYVYAADVADSAAMKRVVGQWTQKHPPIRGVIQSAAVLNDSIYDNMTHELWRGAVAPKIQGSWLLHELLPQDMDFFVMLSSISGVVGNRSQTNYATGNTFQDELAQYRRDKGLPAVAVDLGLMLDVGLIAERGGFTNLRKSEAVGLNEVDFHAIMKAAMLGVYGNSTVPAQLVTGLPTGGILHRQALEPPFYYDDPRFSYLRKMDLSQAIAEVGSNAAGASVDGGNLATQLGQAKSIGKASALTTSALSGLLAKGLQTSADNIDTSKPLHSYGVDSLMAVEIRTWIMQQVKADITLFDILSGMSIVALSLKIVKASKLVPVDLE